jgi:hypothetical protein
MSCCADFKAISSGQPRQARHTSLPSRSIPATGQKSRLHQQFANLIALLQSLLDDWANERSVDCLEGLSHKTHCGLRLRSLSIDRENTHSLGSGFGWLARRAGRHVTSTQAGLKVIAALPRPVASKHK